MRPQNSGCQHCYPERLVTGKMGMKNVWGSAPDTPRARTSAANWAKVSTWHRKAAAGERKKVFCGSLMDSWEEHPTPHALRLEVFDIIRRTPNLDWLLLTKRPENIQRFLPADWGQHGWPNVWLGATIEANAYVQRAMYLTSIPAPAVSDFTSILASRRLHMRFLSQLCSPRRIRKWFADGAVSHFVASHVPRSIWQYLGPVQTMCEGTPDGITGVLLLVIAGCANGFAEELVMWAYLITRLQRLLSSTWAAVAVTTAMFASYHIYQGVGGVISAAAGGIVYAIGFCWFRRPWPLCFAHAAQDILALFWGGGLDSRKHAPKKSPAFLPCGGRR
jgi:membrane protease YdiL (CAAX protease family)